MYLAGIYAAAHSRKPLLPDHAIPEAQQLLPRLPSVQAQSQEGRGYQSIVRIVLPRGAAAGNPCVAGSGSGRESNHVAVRGGCFFGAGFDAFLSRTEKGKDIDAVPGVGCYADLAIDGIILASDRRCVALDLLPEALRAMKSPVRRGRRAKTQRTPDARTGPGYRFP